MGAYQSVSVIILAITLVPIAPLCFSNERWGRVVEQFLVVVCLRMKRATSSSGLLLRDTRSNGAEDPPTRHGRSDTIKKY
jgi:hypothetical protein